MNLLSKAGIVVGSILIAAATGYFYGKGNKEIERIEVKGETTTVFKDRIVVHEVIKTVAPDGTVTETTRDVTEEQVQNTHETTTSSSEISKKVNPQYSLGLYAGPVEISKQGLSDYDFKRNFTLEGSMRIVGPVWGGILVSPFNRSLALGVRIEL